MKDISFHKHFLKVKKELEKAQKKLEEYIYLRADLETIQLKADHQMEERIRLNSSINIK